jgi:hypothetical protein
MKTLGGKVPINRTVPNKFLGKYMINQNVQRAMLEMAYALLKYHGQSK